ncbi:spore maturation protein B [Synechocystis sp. PCC 6803]|uniref:Spore maturation protein B n=3 Tax=Synechocystis TaxID=1142 RepID=P72784_SYNY3|nr:spore maturation protein B [Synechocystis sp. PCC 6803]AVP88413.1 nucleoside recognition protein [Synechocystis sp. IPPAS B-1465]MBD2617086.1 nucleoside recognition protein [Synechocystis sp. FACHB-898]MBD2638677.1 nucleoside recognition protein [Synechocystis sp. FACHB-908]MBD2659706.1 nucleoside recognition protein [Synechocystis sp. FACHB-929]BAL27970.1 spore maturation protein B [Synechocystis sp. PCC 6803 substr. GT-I]BAL31140.1 spore maturation protein B [Synechocystis sp. PCC 6803 s
MLSPSGMGKFTLGVMLNYIWFAIILLSVIAGTVTGKIEAVTEAAIESAGTAVELSIGLIGIMALWLGMMKIAEAAGLVELIAKLVKPITIKLFPDVPPEHPAIGSIVLNMSANILGLGNAATPLGLKAMQELEEINPNKSIATDAMCMFLAINTSSVQLILPATVVGLMGTAANDIFFSTILATTCSTATAIIAAKLLARLKIFALPATVEPEEEFN